MGINTSLPPSIPPSLRPPSTPSLFESAVIQPRLVSDSASVARCLWTDAPASISQVLGLQVCVNAFDYERILNAFVCFWVLCDFHELITTGSRINKWKICVSVGCVCKICINKLFDGKSTYFKNGSLIASLIIKIRVLLCLLGGGP